MDGVRYERSQAVYERASIIPGRSLTRSKAPGRLFQIGQGPLYASHGDGAVLTDCDGHEYIDMLCALGAISLGYGANDRALVRADGVYSLPSAWEVEAAEAVRAQIAPWATSCRFTKTGSEATHAAYRIAKRATGRPFVFIGDWAYHGWHEWCERRPDGRSESFHTVCYPHGADLRATTGHGVHPLNVDPDEVAAVFIEPHRWMTAPAGWYQDVRAFCTQHGILLVMDEMIYGLRWAMGGRTELEGIIPDLACYGKALGNGASIACVVGRDALEQYGEIVSGTYSGETASLAAVVDTLDRYRTDAVIETLWARGRQLADGLDRMVAGTTIRREGAPVHQRLVFPDPPAGQRFAAAMAARGVLWHPDVVNVCAAHTVAQIGQVLTAAADCLGVRS